jgi:hypothetical protein
MAVLAECCERLGMQKRPTLLESIAFSSPALHGLFRPRLLLPKGFAERFSPAELRFVFLHELAHLKRCDLPLNWVMVALQVMHWFNPLVWFGFARWRADRELACDAMALEIAGQEQSVDYGRTILRLLETVARPMSTPGLVGILEDKRQLRRRIDMIASYIPARGWSRLAMLLIGGLAVIGLTDAQSRSESPTNPNASQQKGYEMKMSNSIAHAGVMAMLALTSPTTLHAGETAAAAPSQLAQDLLGTWVLVGQPGKVGKAPEAGGRYKFFTGDHWCITQADPKNGVVIFHHGGSYSIDGNGYIETVEYANPSTMDRIGRTNSHKIKIENGTLTDIGTGKNSTWQEVWKRVETKAEAASPPQLAQGLIGTWVLTGESDNTGEATAEGRRPFKFITASSWCDTQSDPKTGVAIIHHGGAFTLKGNRYVESVEYANPVSMDLIGHSFKFDIKLDGDTLKLTGIGNPWNEVWQRAK